MTLDSFEASCHLVCLEGLIPQSLFSMTMHQYQTSHHPLILR